MTHDKENGVLIADDGKYLTNGTAYAKRVILGYNATISKWYEVDEIPKEVTNKELVEQAKEKSRPLTEAEVSRMLITQQINTLTVDDNTALRMKDFYPEWAEGTEYTEKAGRPVGYKVRRNNKLWKLRQEHTSQTGWAPGADGTESLWEEVNEIHSGELTDPIPYNGNMALTAGLYYIQDGVIYLCNRDTVNPVYQPLRELVGLYVEPV